MMQAIVLAGGQGSRLRVEVPGVPKPLAPIRGRPFLERLLSYWAAQGIRSFILATGFGADAIERHFEGTSIAFSREETP
ncbi:MAG TPA: NTP transferase domain-containing protein, partial [Bdellovibrionota bacterium]|nr:NTP transferase domain-containing protein [Bdellovibrionota bacterium]